MSITNTTPGEKGMHANVCCLSIGLCIYELFNRMIAVYIRTELCRRFFHNEWIKSARKVIVLGTRIIKTNQKCTRALALGTKVPKRRTRTVILGTRKPTYSTKLLVLGWNYLTTALLNCYRCSHLLPKLAAWKWETGRGWGGGMGRGLGEVAVWGWRRKRWLKWRWLVVGGY